MLPTAESGQKLPFPRCSARHDWNASGLRRRRIYMPAGRIYMPAGISILLLDRLQNPMLAALDFKNELAHECLVVLLAQHLVALRQVQPCRPKRFPVGMVEEPWR